jgi:hypothetical protein
MKVILKMMTFFFLMIIFIEICLMSLFGILGYQVRAWADDYRGVGTEKVILELKVQTQDLKSEIRRLQDKIDVKEKQ